MPFLQSHSINLKITKASFAEKKRIFFLLPYYPGINAKKLTRTPTQANEKSLEQKYLFYLLYQANNKTRSIWNANCFIRDKPYPGLKR